MRYKALPLSIRSAPASRAPHTPTRPASPRRRVDPKTVVSLIAFLSLGVFLVVPRSGTSAATGGTLIINQAELASRPTSGAAWQAMVDRHPALAPYRPHTLFAVGHDYVEPDHRLRPGDELCLFPPVSGGSTPADDIYQVVDTPLSADAVAAAVDDPGAGGIVIFSGVVRNETGGRPVKFLEYEAHTAMAEAKIRGLKAFYGFDDPKGYEFFSVHQDIDVYHSQSERDAVAAAATTDIVRAGLEEATAAAPVVVVDVHAEATSEKVALSSWLDGRVTAVLGTHTHVQTSDERILPGGTAALTDVGMTGPYEGVIGFKPDRVLQRFLLQTPSSFEVAKRDVRLAAALVDVDEATGRARAIERMLVPDREE